MLVSGFVWNVVEREYFLLMQMQFGSVPHIARYRKSALRVAR
jgi:hypothetical protein